MAAVRRAEVSDIAALSRIRIDTWQATYRGIIPDAVLDALDPETTRARWQRTLADGAGRGLFVYVVEDHDGVEGYVGVGPETGAVSGHPGEVYMLYVHPTCHGRGYGKLLLRQGLVDLTERGLLPALVWVLHDNPARAFYEHMGAHFLTSRQVEIGQTLLEDGFSFPARPGGA